MGIEIKKGNFEFVDEIYPEIYMKLCNAEKNAYLDCEKAGMNLRDVFEMWLSRLVEEYGLNESNSRTSLNDKRKILTKNEKLPLLSKYNYIAVNGTKRSLNGYLLWQKFGNQCAHSEKVENDPDVTYGNTETVLEIVHRVFLLEYVRKVGENASKKIPSFNPFIMPIGDNYVIKSYEPSDKPVSNCIREYETCAFNENGRISKYGIIRVFRKRDMDEKLLQLRDQEAFSEAESEAGIQFDGNVQVDVLSKMSSKNTDYYVVIYKFSQKPAHLSDVLLKEMSPEERIQLCYQISKIITSLHNLSTPIYHRNLSFDSIYVCKNKLGIYESSVIKLECAKIASEEFGTVIANVQNMQTMIRQQKLLKYSAPEVRMMLQNESLKVDWEKADIYSLGILFADILYGKIEANIIPAGKLQRAGVKTAFIQLIDKMKNPNASLRPSAQRVNQIISEMD